MSKLALFCSHMRCGNAIYNDKLMPNNLSCLKVLSKQQGFFVCIYKENAIILYDYDRRHFLNVSFFYFMWNHDLNQLNIQGKSTSKRIDFKLVKKANLGKYFYSTLGVLSTDFQSPYYSPLLVLGNGNKECEIIFTSYGIILAMVNIVINHDYSNNGSGGTYITYAYSGAIGFLSCNNITNIYSTPKLIHQSMYISTKNNYFTFTFTKGLRIRNKTWFQHLLNVYKPVYAYPIITEGNIFDLDNDPSFAGLLSHIVNLKQYYRDYSGSANNELIGIKARYSPRFNSNLFHDCTKIRKYFIASFTAHYILLLKLEYNSAIRLFFFTKEAYYIPPTYLTNEAVFAQSYSKQKYIITSPTFVLIVTTPPISYERSFFFITHNNLLTQYMTTFNPLFLPKNIYKKYIKKQYRIIAHDYITNAKSLIGKFKLYIASSWRKYFEILGIVGFINFVILESPRSHTQGVPLAQTLLASFIIGSCIESWYTFYHSQLTKPIAQIIITIISLIALYAVFVV